MQLISTFSFLEIVTFFSVIEMYIKNINVRNFKFLAFRINFTSGFVSNVHTYVKSTHPVSLVLSTQNAQCFYISAPLLLKCYEAVN